MPKFAYIKKDFHRSSLEVIDLCNQVIRSYLAQGYTLTLRQLYYRLVAGGHIPNRQKEYKRLGRIVNDARLTGVMDWNAIEDRTRALAGNSHWDNPTSILKSAQRGFQIDRWEDQPWRVEVWVEKDALMGVVGRVCRELDVDYFSCRGYTSQSEMWRASGRYLNYLEDQDVLLIHLADHDPSGIDMTRDIEDRLTMFWADTVKVHRVALNMDQVRQYNPPPNPAKTTDSRFGMYIAEFGRDSWELDALEPAVLADLIRDAVINHRDEMIWQETLDREKEMMGLLEDALVYVEERDEWN